MIIIDNYCVYVHTNKINNKIYIGITNNIERRWRSNGVEYKPKEKNTSSFWNAIEKYGWDNFKHEILLTNLSREVACEYEKYYISLSKSNDKNIGYNIASGGNGGHIYQEHPKGMLGKHHTDEFKAKHSERMSGEKNPFYGKQHEKHPKGFLGKQHSKESKNKTSKTCKERKINCKKVKVIFTDDTIKIYDSIQEVMKDLNVSYSFCHKLLKSGDEFVMKKNNHNKDLKCFVGIKMFYLDNIEVTHEAKIS